MELFSGPKEPLEDLDPSSFPLSPYSEKMNILMRRAFVLSVETHAEVLMLFGLGGHVQQYASERFEPLVMDTSGRAVLVKMLLDDQGKPRELAKDFEGEAQPAWPEDPEANERCDVEKAAYIEDDVQREKTFRSTLLWMQRRLKEIAHAQGSTDEWAVDVLLLVATPNGKIMSFESPCFRPLIAEEAGQRMIKTVLNTPSHSHLH